ncbi:MAG TPA: phage holin family protein [Kineosporiaceae bacterium]|nr:phage holin family protein [Kineosporiaceae bacterium]
MSPMQTRPPGTDRDEQTPEQDPRSTAELVGDLAELVSRLMREELALAMAELKQKGRSAGRGAGLLSGGGVSAFYGGGALIAAAVLALSQVWRPWLAALVVGVVLLVIAGALALIARRHVRAAVPPTPQRAVSGLFEDVSTVKEALRPEGATR